MELKVRNFAKIKEADFDFQGITVIAGENNTGKSTVGKILFTLFDSYNNILNKIISNRLELVASRVSQRLDDVLDNKQLEMRDFSSAKYYRRFKRVLQREKPINAEQCQRIIWRNLRNIDDIEDVSSNIIDKIHTDIQMDIEKVYSYPDSVIRNGILTSNLNDVFFYQTNSLKNNTIAEASLKIKDKWTHISIKDVRCQKSTENSNINHEAIYIDNPSAIDNCLNFSDLRELSDPIHKILRKKLGRKSNSRNSNILAEVMKQDQLKTVMDKLNGVIHGTYVENNIQLAIHQEGLREDLFVNNLSEGLKAFAILKRLLENDELNEQDVLILDEPEIHLHPEWQLVYAELIVLLQKTFNLTVLLTTHSPYFLEAIEVYAKLHDVSNKVTYYLSQQENEEVTFENVTGHTDRVYQKLLEPFEKLEQLRLQLRMDE